MGDEHVYRRLAPDSPEPTITIGGTVCSRLPCPSCRDARREFLRAEGVMPLPLGASAPLSRYGFRFGGPGKKICHDCAAAEGLMQATHGGLGLSWYQARTTVEGDRQEMLRLPGARIGVTQARPSLPGDLERLLAWQRDLFGDGAP